MIRVLLVDDEPWALKGIRQVFNWNHYGVEIVAEVTNSVKAFDIIYNNKIDVVFSDIRMPEISGIELMNMTKAKGIATEFVFISGFADFQYVQQALKGGALDYFLKPIPRDEADVFLKKLMKIFKNKRLNEDIYHYEALLEKKIKISDFLRDRNLKFSNKLYQVLFVSFHCEAEEDFFLKFPAGTENICLYLGMDKYVYIVNTSTDLFAYLQTTFSGIPDIRIGASSVTEEVQRIPMLLKEANIAMNSYFIFGKCGIYKYSNNNPALLKGIKERLLNTLEVFNDSELKKILEDMPRIFEANSITVSGVVFLWNELVVYLTEKLDNRLPLEMQLMDYTELLSRFKSMSMMCDYLYEVFTTSMEIIQDSEISNDVKDAFNKMLQYIDQNYAEDLYLKELADKFHLNFTYTCSLFKKSVSMTFSKYITSLRMGKASEMLINTPLTIDEICTRVGYNDYFYFIKIFKKSFGVTPSQYRKERADNE